MNPSSRGEAKKIINQIREKIIKNKIKSTKTIICPPALYLPQEADKWTKNNLAFGAQNCFWQDEGAWTGELSPLQFKEAGASYVIIGHSERRQQGETDLTINNKLKSILRQGLTAILCVGETERDSSGFYLAQIHKQLELGLAKINRKQSDQIIIAYEPVWAIGATASKAETPEAFHHNALFIRKALSQIISKEAVKTVPIIYGGSVSVKNAKDFLTIGQADGLLIGRESLNPHNFFEIIKQAETLK